MTEKEKSGRRQAHKQGRETEESKTHRNLRGGGLQRGLQKRSGSARVTGCFLDNQETG